MISVDIVGGCQHWQQIRGFSLLDRSTSCVDGGWCNALAFVVGRWRIESVYIKEDGVLEKSICSSSISSH